jgi:DUF1009 family protein
MIAGNGYLPLEVIRHCQEKKRDLYVIGLTPFVILDNLTSVPHSLAKIGEIGKIFKAMKENKVEEIVFAGGLRRPSFSEISPDFEGAKLLAKLAFTKVSDDTIFRAIIDEIEKRGYRVISVQEAVPEILFQEGVYGKVSPSEQDMSDIQRGVEVAKALGAVDVGQSVVVQEGMVLAVEAIEGTDMLLSRAATVKRKGKDPVMVKIIKPGQETRIDFPVIGPATIEELIKYKIRGLAVEAGGILIIDQKKVIEMANKAGIFIIGLNVND